MIINPVLTMSVFSSLRSATARRCAAWLLAVACRFVFVTRERAAAQIVSRGNLFGPGATPPTIGAEIGLSKHTQLGSFLAACNCEFSQGAGTGIIGNIIFELPLSYEWVIGLKTGVDFKNSQSVKTIAGGENSIVRFARNDSVAVNLLNYDRHGDVKTTYILAMPFVKYQFFRIGPFVQLGPSVEFLVGNHFTHTRKLSVTRVELPDGNVLENLRFEKTGTREEELENGDIANVNGIRLGLQLTAGYDISVSERSIIAPMFTYDFPLSTIRDDDASGWKIGSLNFSAALRFKLD
jgi:hypothetical protein